MGYVKYRTSDLFPSRPPWPPIRWWRARAAGSGSCWSARVQADGAHRGGRRDQGRAQPGRGRSWPRSTWKRPGISCEDDGQGRRLCHTQLPERAEPRARDRAQAHGARGFATSSGLRHELSTKLGFYERTLTAVLNAKLIPIIADLVLSVKKVMAGTRHRRPADDSQGGRLADGRDDGQGKASGDHPVRSRGQSHRGQVPHAGGGGGGHRRRRDHHRHRHLEGRANPASTPRAP